MEFDSVDQTEDDGPGPQRCNYTNFINLLNIIYIIIINIFL